ncbi:MAG: Fe-Mn family superoxide dismutase [bacterium]|nr:Fe-Mn family superoxide dismutase [bacterium]
MYEAEDFSRLLGTPGFSDTLLKNHFTLYEGYVKNTNALADRLKQLLDEEKLSSPEYAELKRRFGWEFDGMRLHECYFDNMTNSGAAPNGTGALAQKITEQFGSYERWEKDFKATGAMRGIGWAILRYDRETGTLFNVWANEHDVGHLAGTKILLIMDVFEHAFMLDYGLKRADYIEAFFKAIDWKKVEKRYEMK